MKIYKLLIIVFAFTMTTKSFAQGKYGVKTGLNLANLLEKDNDYTYSDDYSMRIGFHLGGTAEFPISEKLSAQAGLLYSTKGFRFSSLDDSSGNSSESFSVILQYFEIPINVIYKIELGGLKLCLNAGPYLGYAFRGVTKDSEDFSIDLNIGSSEGDVIKALDYGFNIGAGVEINDAITIGLQYGLGLANIASYTENGYRVNNRVIGISFGYMFGQ